MLTRSCSVRPGVAAFPMSAGPAGLLKEFENVIDSLMSGNGETPAAFKPAVDVLGDEQGFTVVMDLPGYRLSELDVTVHEKTLTVSGKPAEPAQADTPSPAMLRQERRRGEFTRSFRFAEDIDQAGVTARLEHGVLTLRLPRTAATAARKVSIAGG